MDTDNCTLCLEPYIYFDLNIIFNCGHQFHYSCICKVKDKSKCCICNTKVTNSAIILWTRETHFYKQLEPLAFFSNVMYTTIYSDIIQQKLVEHKINKTQQLMVKYKQIIQDYIKEYLKIFYVKILEACNKNRNYTVLIKHPYRYSISGVPYIFLLRGPKYYGTSYFEMHGIRSLLGSLQDLFGDNFIIYEYFKNNRMNGIAARWVIPVLKHSN